jgi:hypothetical protein
VRIRYPQPFTRYPNDENEPFAAPLTRERCSS